MRLLKDTFGWGFLLWLLGYVLGIILYMMVPPAAIGWIITPIATTVAIWVLLRLVKGNSLLYYLSIGVVWTLIAVLLDYFLIVKLFNPVDGYYKLDVYLYYGLTYLLPVLVCLWKKIQ